MTKKHYVQIAKAINEAIKMEGNIERVNPAIEHIIDELVISLQVDNLLFNEKRFREAIYK